MTRAMLMLASLSVVAAPCFRASVAVAAAAQESTLIKAIEDQGGTVIRDADGRVTEISLARTWATDADVERIAALKGLKKLDLSLTYVSDLGIERLKSFDQLEDLNLYAAEFVTDAALAFLRGHKTLKTLNLRGTDVTDTSLAYIAELPALTALDISFTQITDVGLEHLASLPGLEELNLGGNKISGVGLHVLKLLPKLRKLSFYGVQRRNAGWCWAPVVTDSELDTVTLLSGLQDLNIGSGVTLGTPRPNNLGPADGEAECRIAGGSRVTDAGLAKVARLKKLRQLDLSGALITPGGLKVLASLPELQRLSLWNIASVDDTASPYLETLGSLTSLDLSNTGVGDATLARLAKMSGLRRLYLSETKVTPAGLAAFRKQHPACLVSAGARVAPRVPLSPGTPDAR